MAVNVWGGGSQTTNNGLKFEQETDLADALLATGQYEINDNKVFYKYEHIATLAPKHKLYSVLLEPKGVNYTEIISKKLLPDEAIYVKDSETVFIIEKKFQSCDGSVDEKLQTCGFKKEQYMKLFQSLNLKVEYIYLLSDWFKNEKYRDVLEYILNNGCSYYYNEIPLDSIDLPHSL